MTGPVIRNTSLSTAPAWFLARGRPGGWVKTKSLVLAFIFISLLYSTINVFFSSSERAIVLHSEHQSDARPAIAPELLETENLGSDSRSRNKSDIGNTGKSWLDVNNWAEKISFLNPFRSSHSTDVTMANSPIRTNMTMLSSHFNHEYHDIVSSDYLPLGERVRVAKVSILFGGTHPVYERALRTHEAHDRLHGYPIFVLRESLLDDVWTKPAYILSLILRELAKPKGQRLEWLFWIDADTIVLNYKVPIELFLPPLDDPDFGDVHMVVTHDWNGLNNGVFPIRVNAWAAELLAGIVSFRDYRPDTHLTFRDQSAMDFLLRERKFAKHVVRAPQRWFNAYQGEANETLAPFQIRRGDFLVHFPGVGNREERMRYWCERAEAHAPEWEMDVQYTGYPNEVKAFWSDLRVQKRFRAEEWAKGQAALKEEVVRASGLLSSLGAEMDKEALQNMSAAIAACEDMKVDGSLDEDTEYLTNLKINLIVVSSY
jgi:hypothetical protein